MLRRLSFALLLLVCGATVGATNGFAGPSDLTIWRRPNPSLHSLRRRHGRARSRRA